MKSPRKGTWRDGRGGRVQLPGMRAGGTVSVTLTDGSKVTSAIHAEVIEVLWIADGTIRLRTLNGSLGGRISSIDSYEPAEADQ